MSRPTETQPPIASSAATEPVRVINTTGIHNFRDYGGYRVSAGGRVAWKRLYRAGEDAEATAHDLEVLGALGLAGIIDLRGTSERGKSPSRFPANGTIPVICSDGETTPAPHADAAATAFDVAAARRTMLERYAGLPFRQRLGNVYRRYFALLAETWGPTLVHCTAGKDRTGFLVALLHHALGVHRDDIFEDYLLTNTVGDVPARVAALRRDLERRFGAPMSDEAVNVVVSVDPQFLQTAFDSVTERYGTVDVYLAEVLGVTPQVRDALVERLVVTS
jgi:protein tyrosine/serine phosphatase